MVGQLLMVEKEDEAKGVTPSSPHPREMNGY